MYLMVFAHFIDINNHILAPMSTVVITSEKHSIAVSIILKEKSATEKKYNYFWH